MKFIKVQTALVLNRCLREKRNNIKKQTGRPHRFSAAESAGRAILKIYSEIVEISSEIVEISSEIVEISSELISANSEVLKTNAFRNALKPVFRTPLSAGNPGKDKLFRFTSVSTFVKTATSRTAPDNYLYRPVFSDTKARHIFTKP